MSKDTLDKRGEGTESKGELLSWWKRFTSWISSRFQKPKLVTTKTSRNKKMFSHGFLDCCSRILSGILWIFLIGTLFWWFIAVIIWPINDGQSIRQTLDLDGSGKYSLDIWSPGIVLSDAEKVDIKFSLSRESLGDPIYVNLKLPSELVVVGPQNYQQSSKVVLEFNGLQLRETKTIKIINAGLEKGLQPLETKIEVDVQDHEMNTISTSSIPIKVESSFRYILRTFGGSTPGSIPLFPLASLLVTIGGLYFKEYRERRLEVEKREEKLKTFTQESFNKVRAYLKHGDISTARQELTRIQSKDATVYLEFSDLEKLDYLLKLSEGDVTKSIPDDLLKYWGEETTAVLEYMLEHNLKNRINIYKSLRGSNVDQIENTEIRRKLNSVLEALGSNEPVVTARWPSSADATKIKLFKIHGNYNNPFLAWDAKSEINLLFNDTHSHFWDHPSREVKVIKQISNTTFIVGNPGSGHTALAYALERFEPSEPEFFTCYLSGVPSLTTIRSTLAVRLLHFITNHPQYLMCWGDEQKKLGAQVLVNEIGKSIVLSQIEQASLPGKWTWWSVENPDDDKKEIWKAETLSHLKILKDFVVRSEYTSIPDRLWGLALSTSNISLKFKKSIIIIDSGNLFNWRWFNQVIYPYEDIWNDHNLYCIILCDRSVFQESNQGKSYPDFISLAWSKQDLKKLVLGAVGKSLYLPSRPPPIFDVIGEDAFDELLTQAKNSPQRLIQIWQKLFGSYTSSIPADKNDVLRIAEEID